LPEHADSPAEVRGSVGPDRVDGLEAAERVDALDRRMGGDRERDLDRALGGRSEIRGSSG
jgi:hypothetical protein